MNKVNQIAERTATHIGNISQGCIETLIKEIREKEKADLKEKIKAMKKDHDNQCKINFVGGMERCDAVCDCGAVEENEVLDKVITNI